MKPNGLLANGSERADDGAAGGGDIVGVGRAEIVDIVPVDRGCSTDDGYVGTVAEAGGESSHRRSLIASGTAGWEGAVAGAKPRIDGGIRDDGIVVGMSLPANLP